MVPHSGMLLLLLACAEEPVETVDLVTELTSPGPYAVGYRVSEVRYEDPDGERVLRLALWYPSSDKSGHDAEYLDALEAPGVWEDAQPASGSFPLVVFSHGHRGYAENSGFLMQHLASHGWVVAAPDHTGNTTFDDEYRHTNIYYQRPLDISAVIDHMLALSADDPLHGLPRQPIVAMGHSFGGYTLHALAGATYDLEQLLPACADGTGNPNFCGELDEAAQARFAAGFFEDRISAFIPMAAGDYGLFGPGLATAQGPILMMNGTLDPNTELPLIWEGLQGEDREHLTILGGGHQTFTDFSGILEHMDGLIDPEEGFRIIDAWALAWARVYTGDESPRPLLDGEVSVSDSAEIER